MTTCEDVKILLADYVAGSLSKNRRAIIKNHLYACPGCQRELRAHERIGELLSQTPPVEFPSDPRLQWAQIASKISQEQRGSIRWGWLDWIKIPPALRFASTLLILLLVGSTLMIVLPQSARFLEPELPMVGISVVESYLSVSWRDQFVQRGNIAMEIENLNRGSEGL